MLFLLNLWLTSSSIHQWNFPMTSTAMGSNDASHLFVYLLEFFHKENSFALPIYLFNYLLISIWTHGDLFYSLGCSPLLFHHES